MTILIAYQLSGYKCFKYYYTQYVCRHLQDYFDLVSYNRFIELTERVYFPLQILCQLMCQKSKKTGIYYIDSTKIQVCHNKRIKQHKVFKGAAGKTSMGWFYGFKLHLVINHLGEIVTFILTSGNKADNNQNLLHELFQGLEGLCFGDKGYLTAIWNELYAQGVKLVTRLKKNMKNKLTLPYELYLLRKRAVIESINNIFKQCLDLEHTRHRKPENGITHMLCSVIAYHFYENKPCIKLPHIGRKLKS